MNHLVQMPGHFRAYEMFRALSKCLFNIDRHGALTTSVGSQLQCFTMLPGKKCMHMSHSNLLTAALNCSHASYRWIRGRRDHKFPLHFPSSGSCGEK